MDNMNNLAIETEVVEIVAEATEKLSFGQNALAYGIAATFVTGAITIGWLSYKGGYTLTKMIMNKKKKSVETFEEVIDADIIDEDENINECSK